MHTNDLRKLARETNDGILRGPALGAADEIDRLRAEIEQLTKERDEARDEHRFTLGLLDRTMTERDVAKKLLRSCLNGNNTLRGTVQDLKGQYTSPPRWLRSMLADAERDMRQMAADYLQSAADDWRSDGHEHNAKKIEDEIPGVLALPLKHADREGESDD